MSIRAKPRDQASGRKVTPPAPTYMDNKQFSSYLADLRTNRIARPGGARPLPGAGNTTAVAKTSLDSTSSTNSSSFGFNRRESGRLASGTARTSLDSTTTTTATHPTHQHGNGSDGSGPKALVVQPNTTSSATSTLPSHVSVSGSIASRASRYSTVTGRGRDYYPISQKPAAPSTAAPSSTMPAPPLRPGEVVPTDIYMENGQRWMEKEEAVSLRQALEHMDLKTKTKDGAAPAKPKSPAKDASVSSADDAEERLYNAALTEAADLVWQHQHGVKPPEPDAPYRYRPHLRKNSYAHARTASVGRYGDDIEPTGLARDPAARSVSASSSSSASSCGSGFAASQRSRYSFTGSRSTRVVSGGSGGADNSARPSLERAEVTVNVTTTGSTRRPLKSYKGIAAAGPRPMPGAASAACPPAGARRRSSMKRNISGEIEKPFSGDQIYEEPETATPQTKTAAAQPVRDAVLQVKRSAANVSTDSEPKDKAFKSADASKSTDHGVSKLVSRFEIHRNPPTQSHNPQYTTNAPQPHSFLSQEGPEQSNAATSADMPAPLQVPRKNGVEIRSDDIRQATSMRLKDRSPKLPTPSFVSDNPGRPIVSFDGDWKAPKEEAATDAKPDARRKNIFARGSDGRRGGIATSAQVSHGEAKKQTGALPPTPSDAATSSAGSHTAPVVPSQQHQQLRREEPQTHRPFQRHAPSISVSSWESQAPASGSVQNPLVPTIAISDASEPTKPASMTVPTISISPEPTERSKSSAQPPIPTIVLPGESDDDDKAAPGIPIIVTPDDAPAPARAPATPAKTPSARPLPTPVHGATGASIGRPRGHWSRAPAPYPASATGSIAGGRATALCHACQEPIVGRFIALAGVPGLRNQEGASNSGNGSERFHPECFRCYACGTRLEALEISPEPDAPRNARLGRIARRARGETLEEKPGETMAEDGDDRLRFYCHLDWHELFAPRCKHCTTPIMGEHVVALGAHWHVGHFFCAECGEPFGPGATHIEKDGYAWCVGCQARRTERRAPKCRACGTAVIGQYIQALGAEWHESCFRCGVCHGGFADGQVFPREGGGGLMQVVCTGCRQRELKA